jgi:AraC-like DNA-binding protein
MRMKRTEDQDSVKVSPGMSDLLRAPRTAVHPALERHYSIDEVAALWRLSRQTVRRVFDDEAGVLRYGRGDSSRRRGYQTLRIPESVVVRVHGRLRS